MVKAIWAVACSVLVVLNIAAPLALPAFAQDAAGMVAPARNVPMPTDNSIQTRPAPLTSQRAIMDNSAKIRRPALPLTGSQADPSYRLGPEDQLRISVWDNKELTLDLVVRPDGKISMPLLQDVPAEGLTAAQLAADIQEGLSAYIVDSRSYRDRAAGQRAEILYYRICNASGNVPFARRHLGSPGPCAGGRIDPVRIAEEHQADPGHARETGCPKNQLL